MPSKKKKYNARFPPARIKKIMQTDEEVGKVAAAVPVIISRSLELFIDSLIEKTATITKGKNAKTLSTSHVKQAIHSEKTFDFLRDLVANVPDHQTEEEIDNIVASSSGTQEKKIRRPRKPREDGARGPGRPRKVKIQEKKESSSATESDEETETDEEERPEYEAGSSYEAPSQFMSPPQTSSSSHTSGSPHLQNSPQHNYPPPQTYDVGQSQPQMPLATQSPPPAHPMVHALPSATNMPDDLSHSAQYSQPPQSDMGMTRPQFPPITSAYHMHNIPIPQYPYTTAVHPMDSSPYMSSHPNMNSNHNPQFMAHGMPQYPPQFVPPPYMMPSGSNGHGQSMYLPRGTHPAQDHPMSEAARRFTPPVYDDGRHNANTIDMPLDMSMSTKLRSQNESVPQEMNPSRGLLSQIPVPHGLPTLSPQELMHRAYAHGQYTGQPAYTPEQNSDENMHVQHSRHPEDFSRDMSKAAFEDAKHKANKTDTDAKKAVKTNNSKLNPRESKSRKRKDSSEQSNPSFASISNIMNIKPGRTVNDDDDDYDT